MSDALVGALIGLVGLLVGLLGGEYFRRHSRIEEYSKEIFHKRLEIYEVIYKKLNAAIELASEFEMADVEDLEKLMPLSHTLVMETAQFGDENGLYINDEVLIQCMLTLMILPSEGTLDELQEFKHHQLREFQENCKTSKSMIKEETGLRELDRLFRGITRAKHNSDYVKYYKDLKRQHGIK